MQWDYIQELVAHGGVPDVYGLCDKEENINVLDLNATYVNQFINFLQPGNSNKVVDSDIQKETNDKCLSELPEVAVKNRKESYNSTCHGEDSEVNRTNLLNTNKVTATYSFCKDKCESLSKTKEEINHRKTVDCVSCLSEQPNIENITQYKAFSNILEQYKDTYNFLCTSDEDKPLNLVKNLKDNKSYSNRQIEDKKKLCNFSDIKTTLKDCAISDRTNHSCNIETYCNTTYKEVDYGLLKFSDLDDLSHNLKTGKTLLNVSKHKLCENIEENSEPIPNKCLRQESTLALNKYLNDKASLLLCEKKHTDLSFPHSSLNVKDTNIKSESCSDDRANKTRSTHFASTRSKPPLSNWDDFEMSGQYPGHSRPPVGTPPPQTVWNHLTMTQGQGNSFLTFPCNCFKCFTHNPINTISYLFSKQTFEQFQV